MPTNWRERLGNKSKVSIVGFCTTSRDLVPYDDPDMEIWGLNRGYMFMPRADRWFEMHGRNIYSSQQRRPGRHVEWLNAFPGPVYMHSKFEDITTCEVYPLKEMAGHFGEWVFRVGREVIDAEGRPGIDLSAPMRNSTGEPYLSSSIAYEIALAIAEGFQEIHLYGVDLNTEAEYAWQKPGVEYLLGVAVGRGIRVVLPDNCPLLKGTLYGRSFLSERPETMSYEQLTTRMKSLQHEIGKVQENRARIEGAIGELDNILAQMPPGIDHELEDSRRKKLAQMLQEHDYKLGKLGGAIEETGFWLHQTYGGQDPKEAIRQLVPVEGPVDEVDLLMQGFEEAPRELAAAGV